MGPGRRKLRGELWSLFALLFLSQCGGGCGQTPVPGSTPAPISEAVLIARAIPLWEEHTGTLATSEDCLAMLATFQVVVLSRTAFEAVTEYDPDTVGGVLVLTNGTATAVTYPGVPLWPIASHEMAHLLSVCAAGSLDVDHNDPAVWSRFVPALCRAGGWCGDGVPALASRVVVR